MELSQNIQMNSSNSTDNESPEKAYENFGNGKRAFAATFTPNKVYEQNKPALYQGNQFTPNKQAEQDELMRQSLAMNGKRIVKNGQIATHTKDLSYMDYLSEKRKIEDAIETTTQKIPHAPLFCTPNCQHKHFCNFQYDYSKNYTDPYNERPGVDFLCDVKKTPLAGLDTKNIVGETGCNQSPINLDTGLEIS